MEKPAFSRKPLRDEDSKRTYILRKCLTIMRELETEGAVQLLRQLRGKQILSLTVLQKIIKQKYKQACYILYMNSSTILQDKSTSPFPVVSLNKFKLLQRQLCVRGSYTC